MERAMSKIFLFDYDNHCTYPHLFESRGGYITMSKSFSIIWRVAIRATFFARRPDPSIRS